MLMSVEDPFDDPNYHRPEDDVESIQLGNLRTTGVLAAHTLAAWAGGGPTRPLPPTGRRVTCGPDSAHPTCPAWPMGSMTCDHGRCRGKLFIQSDRSHSPQSFVLRIRKEGLAGAFFDELALRKNARDRPRALPAGYYVAR